VVRLTGAYSSFFASSTVSVTFFWEDVEALLEAEEEEEDLPVDLSDDGSGSANM